MAHNPNPRKYMGTVIHAHLTRQVGAYIPVADYNGFADRVLTKDFVDDEPVFTRHRVRRGCVLQSYRPGFELVTFKSAHKEDIDWVIAQMPSGTTDITVS